MPAPEDRDSEIKKAESVNEVEETAAEQSAESTHMGEEVLEVSDDEVVRDPVDPEQAMNATGEEDRDGDDDYSDRPHSQIVPEEPSMNNDDRVVNVNGQTAYLVRGELVFDNNMGDFIQRNPDMISHLEDLRLRAQLEGTIPFDRRAEDPVRAEQTRAERAYRFGSSVLYGIVTDDKRRGYRLNEAVGTAFDGLSNFLNAVLNGGPMSAASAMYLGALQNLQCIGQGMTSIGERLRQEYNIPQGQLWDDIKNTVKGQLFASRLEMEREAAKEQIADIYNDLRDRVNWRVVIGNSLLEDDVDPVHADQAQELRKAWMKILGTTEGDRALSGKEKFEFHKYLTDVMADRHNAIVDENDPRAEMVSKAMSLLLEMPVSKADAPRKFMELLVGDLIGKIAPIETGLMNMDLKQIPDYVNLLHSQVHDMEVRLTLQLHGQDGIKDPVTGEWYTFEYENDPDERRKLRVKHDIAKEYVTNLDTQARAVPDPVFQARYAQIVDGHVTRLQQAQIDRDNLLAERRKLFNSESTAYRMLARDDPDAEVKIEYGMPGSPMEELFEGIPIYTGNKNRMYDLYMTWNEMLVRGEDESSEKFISVYNAWYCMAARERWLNKIRWLSSNGRYSNRVYTREVHEEYWNALKTHPWMRRQLEGREFEPVDWSRDDAETESIRRWSARLLEHERGSSTRGRTGRGAGRSGGSGDAASAEAESSGEDASGDNTTLGGNSRVVDPDEDDPLTSDVTAEQACLNSIGVEATISSGVYGEPKLETGRRKGRAACITFRPDASQVDGLYANYIRLMGAAAAHTLSDEDVKHLRFLSALRSWEVASKALNDMDAFIGSKYFMKKNDLDDDKVQRLRNGLRNRIYDTLKNRCPWNVQDMASGITADNILENLYNENSQDWVCKGWPDNGRLATARADFLKNIGLLDELEISDDVVEVITDDEYLDMVMEQVQNDENMSESEKETIRQNIVNVRRRLENGMLTFVCYMKWKEGYGPEYGLEFGLWTEFVKDSLKRIADIPDNVGVIGSGIKEIWTHAILHNAICRLAMAHDATEAISPERGEEFRDWLISMGLAEPDEDDEDAILYSEDGLYNLLSTGIPPGDPNSIITPPSETNRDEDAEEEDSQHEEEQTNGVPEEPPVQQEPLSDVDHYGFSNELYKFLDDFGATSNNGLITWCGLRLPKTGAKQPKWLFDNACPSSKELIKNWANYLENVVLNGNWNEHKQVARHHPEKMSKIKDTYDNLLERTNGQIKDELRRYVLALRVLSTDPPGFGALGGGRPYEDMVQTILRLTKEVDNVCELSIALNHNNLALPDGYSPPVNPDVFRVSIPGRNGEAQSAEVCMSRECMEEILKIGDKQDKLTYIVQTLVNDFTLWRGSFNGQLSDAGLTVEQVDSIVKQVVNSILGGGGVPKVEDPPVHQNEDKADVIELPEGIKGFPFDILKLYSSFESDRDWFSTKGEHNILAPISTLLDSSKMDWSKFYSHFKFNANWFNQDFRDYGEYYVGTGLNTGQNKAGKDHFFAGKSSKDTEAQIIKYLVNIHKGISTRLSSHGEWRGWLNAAGVPDAVVDDLILNMPEICTDLYAKGMDSSEIVITAARIIDDSVDRFIDTVVEKCARPEIIAFVNQSKFKIKSDFLTLMHNLTDQTACESAQAYQNNTSYGILHPAEVEDIETPISDAWNKVMVKGGENDVPVRLGDMSLAFLRWGTGSGHVAALGKQLEVLFSMRRSASNRNKMITFQTKFHDGELGMLKRWHAADALLRVDWSNNDLYTELENWAKSIRAKYGSMEKSNTKSLNYSNNKEILDSFERFISLMKDEDNREKFISAIDLALSAEKKIIGCFRGKLINGVEEDLPLFGLRRFYLYPSQESGDSKNTSGAYFLNTCRINPYCNEFLKTAGGLEGILDMRVDIWRDNSNRTHPDTMGISEDEKEQIIALCTAADAYMEKLENDNREYNQAFNMLDLSKKAIAVYANYYKAGALCYLWNHYRDSYFKLYGESSQRRMNELKAVPPAEYRRVSDDEIIRAYKYAYVPMDMSSGNTTLHTGSRVLFPDNPDLHPQSVGMHSDSMEHLLLEERHTDNLKLTNAYNKEADLVAWVMNKLNNDRLEGKDTFQFKIRVKGGALRSADDFDQGIVVRYILERYINNVLDYDNKSPVLLSGVDIRKMSTDDLNGLMNKAIESMCASVRSDGYYFVFDENVLKSVRDNGESWVEYTVPYIIGDMESSFRNTDTPLNKQMTASNGHMSSRMSDRSREELNLLQIGEEASVKLSKDDVEYYRKGENGARAENYKVAFGEDLEGEPIMTDISEDRSGQIVRSSVFIETGVTAGNRLSNMTSVEYDPVSKGWDFVKTLMSDMHDSQAMTDLEEKFGTMSDENSAIRKVYDEVIKEMPDKDDAISAKADEEVHKLEGYDMKDPSYMRLSEAVVNLVQLKKEVMKYEEFQNGLSRILADNIVNPDFENRLGLGTKGEMTKDGVYKAMYDHFIEFMRQQKLVVDTKDGPDDTKLREFLKNGISKSSGTVQDLIRISMLNSFRTSLSMYYRNERGTDDAAPLAGRSYMTWIKRNTSGIGKERTSRVFTEYNDLTCVLAAISMRRYRDYYGEKILNLSIDDRIKLSDLCVYRLRYLADDIRKYSNRKICNVAKGIACGPTAASDAALGSLGMYMHNIMYDEGNKLRSVQAMDYYFMRVVDAIRATMNAKGGVSVRFDPSSTINGQQSASFSKYNLREDKNEENVGHMYPVFIHTNDALFAVSRRVQLDRMIHAKDRKIMDMRQKGEDVRKEEEERTKYENALDDENEYFITLDSQAIKEANIALNDAVCRWHTVMAVFAADELARKARDIRTGLTAKDIDDQYKAINLGLTAKDKEHKFVIEQKAELENRAARTRAEGWSSVPIFISPSEGTAGSVDAVVGVKFNEGTDVGYGDYRLVSDDPNEPDPAVREIRTKLFNGIWKKKSAGGTQERVIRDTANGKFRLTILRDPINKTEPGTVILTPRIMSGSGVDFSANTLVFEKDSATGEYGEPVRAMSEGDLLPKLGLVFIDSAVNSVDLKSGADIPMIRGVTMSIPLPERARGGSGVDQFVNYPFYYKMTSRGKCYQAEDLRKAYSARFVYNPAATIRKTLRRIR